MKEQLKKQSLSDRGIGLGRYNRLIENYNAQNFVFDRNYFTMIQTPGGWVVSLVKKGGVSSSLISFDYSISAAVITINAGKFIVDGRGMYSVAQTPITVTGGTSSVPHWIFMRSSRSSPSPTIVYDASQPNPASNNFFEFPLYSVGLEDGAAKIYNIWHRGANIIVGAVL